MHAAQTPFQLPKEINEGVSLTPIHLNSRMLKSPSGRAEAHQIKNEEA